MARCQKRRSAAKASPARRIARSRRKAAEGGSPATRASTAAHTQRSGSAPATRQNALANGPTSASRAKIGEIPMASAPRRSAASGKALEGATAMRGGGAVPVTHEPIRAWELASSYGMPTDASLSFQMRAGGLIGLERRHD